MGLFTRFTNWIGEHLPWRETSPEPTAPPPPDAPERDQPPSPPPGEDEGGFTRTPSDSELPPGWVLVGLYHQGEKTTRISATGVTDVTDSQIGRADALVVQYLPAGEDGYRWVHGARNWRSLADQIEKTVIVVSPTAE